ncbi:Hypothetical protein CAP_2513 [Chondromyces apiculatus DSM 436]|uniref:Uncharacterized protein n=1 Tax=Chondromyces apiculatus DSM 436 TaxID=1192034 RepID=A0A017THA9_9BACT|nr:Hypothetical protein CAP_2513 [Chondromyces apiculatus DSM 436]
MRGWRRHTDGWQPALLAVFLAGSATLLTLPRAVAPTDVPVPLADMRALARVTDADAARAEALDPAPGKPARVLDVDVRTLGSAIRAFGLEDARPARREPEIATARRQILEALPPALAHGPEEVLALRAFQQRAFVRAVRHWEATGEETEDLLALGGDFPGLVRRSGWVVGEGRRLLLTDHALAVLFKKRWNRVAGVEGAAFEPTLDEERAFYQFLLSYPVREALPEAQNAEARTRAARAAERRVDEYRLKKIGEIAALDPAYPSHLARGVVLFRLGQYEAAVTAFRRHLDAHPDGPHALRARNYLQAAIEEVSEDL